MSNYLKIFFLSMAPISELRGAIPLGILKYHLPWFKVFLISILGNILPIIFLLIFLEKVSLFLKKRINFFEKLWDWILKASYKRHKKKFELLGSLALISLVAIPLPLTGAWTGALASFIFKVKFRSALILIFLGVVIAGIVVTFISLSTIKI